jgi:hypothetical protein
MKKLVLLSTASLLLCASLAQAQINLAWNNCITQGTAAVDKAYACDGSLNGTPIKGVLSFVAPTNIDHFVGIQAVVDVRASTLSALPDWWKLGVGECRDANFGFPIPLTGIGTGTTGACRNPWAGGQTGGGFQFLTEVKGQPSVANPGWGRLLLAFARVDETALIAGQQYFAAVFSLDTFNDIDSGAGVCAGCALPACLVANQLELFQVAGQIPPQQDLYILTAPDVRNFITWNGGAIGGTGCPLSVPARNVTWGSIKAIYR